MPCPFRFPTAAAVAAAIVSATVSAQVILPPEGHDLRRTHVVVQWAPVGGAFEYELQIVVDDGSADPFASAVPVVDLIVDGSMPRTAVTQGLAWGEDYAWRVRGLLPDPLAWSDTHRFSVVPLPSFVPVSTIGGTGVGFEPGITVFPLRASGVIAGGACIAVDAEGTPIWCVHFPAGAGDLRLLPNGHALVESGGRGIEFTLDGEVLWTTPDGFFCHHEVAQMPNGNVMALVNTSQVVNLPGGGTATYNGSRIVEFDKATKAVVFDWNEFDHVSTLDFDPTVGVGDWTHSNAAVFNPADGCIYHSARHLSRITRIAYPSGKVIYTMGFEMPSGDADFGDNLFSFQHSPQLLPNGNMIVYDNGNRRDHVVQTPQTGVTKAVEISFDDNDSPTAASIDWSWQLPLYQQALGDADRLPGGTTLVTGGVTGHLWEVALDGTIVWSLTTPGSPSPYRIYRSERYPSLLPPLPPDLNGDGRVDGGDLTVLLGTWGRCEGNCIADINNDGVIDGADITLLLGNWTP